MEKKNEERIDELKNLKKAIILEKGEELEDIITYGEIDYTNDFVNNPEKIFVVKTNSNGKAKSVFYVGEEKMGEVDEDGILYLTSKYKKLVDASKFMKELGGANVYSLNKLEEIEKKEEAQKQDKTISLKNKKEEIKAREEKPEIEIDLHKKITQTEGIADFIPQIKTKRYQKVIGREETNKRYVFYGVTKEGIEEPIPLEMTEGVNSTQNMISTDSKGNGDARVEIEQAYTMLKFPGRPNEGLSVRKGEMGIIEVDYWRRSANDNYQNIPVNLKSTNQKTTSSEIQKHMDKTKNTREHIDVDVENAKDLIQRVDNEIEFEMLHSNDDNIEIFEIFKEEIEKAAKEQKVSVEAFWKEYKKTTAKTYQERIQKTKERIEEQYHSPREIV